MHQDNVLDIAKCSQNILVSNDDRTAQINPFFPTDGNVKTVLGTVPMERQKSLEDGPSKYSLVF
jgi:hypothetical protein